MNDLQDESRRRALGLIAAGSALGLLAPAAVAAEAKSCPTDGTPNQFVPKGSPDPSPLTDELKKYPKCPYCAMDRTKFQYSRHLVHYEDDLADGTCSIHCAAVSLAINLDRVPKAIYAADFGAAGEIKPLVKVDGATYLIGSKLPATMSKKSKLAFASADAATAVKAEQGGELGSFEVALLETYKNLGEDTIAIRKKRAEMRQQAADGKKG
jgi:copper chaperone NosL